MWRHYIFEGDEICLICFESMDNPIIHRGCNHALCQNCSNKVVQARLPCPKRCGTPYTPSFLTSEQQVSSANFLSTIAFSTTVCISGDIVDTSNQFFCLYRYYLCKMFAWLYFVCWYPNNKKNSRPTETNSLNNVLMDAINSGSQFKVMLALFDKQVHAEIDTANENGETALMKATALGHDQIVYTLLKESAKIDAKNKYELTSFDIIKLSNKSDMLFDILAKAYRIPKFGIGLKWWESILVVTLSFTAFRLWGVSENNLGRAYPFFGNSYHNMMINLSYLIAPIIAFPRLFHHATRQQWLYRIFIPCYLNFALSGYSDRLLFYGLTPWFWSLTFVDTLSGVIFARNIHVAEFCVIVTLFLTFSYIFRHELYRIGKAVGIALIMRHILYVQLLYYDSIDGDQHIIQTVAGICAILYVCYALSDMLKHGILVGMEVLLYFVTTIYFFAIIFTLIIGLVWIVSTKVPSIVFKDYLEVIVELGMAFLMAYGQLGRVIFYKFLKHRIEQQQQTNRRKQQ